MNTPSDTHPAFQHPLRGACVCLLLTALLGAHAVAQPLTPTQAAKLDQPFRQLFLPAGPVSMPADLHGRADTGGVMRYPSIVYVSESIKSPIVIGSRMPGYVTAQLTPSEMRVLLDDPAVRFITPGFPVVALNDLSLALTGASLLHAGAVNNTAYKGQGVILGLIDTGIDWRHLDFRQTSDTTKSRILAIWDQRLTATGGEAPPAGFSYGVEYAQSAINNELDGTPANAVRTMDTEGHGTHVAGTACGNGAADNPARYVGMAPEADILMIRSDMSGAGIADAFTYANAFAKAQGKPIVINFSLGNVEGPHDGTDAISTSIDWFTAAGGTVAAAAGNNGGDLIHTSGTVPAGDSISIVLTVPAYTPASGAGNDDFELEIWMDTDGNTTAEVISPNGLRTTATPGYDFTTAYADGAVYVENSIYASNGDRRVFFRCFDQMATTTPAVGTWTVKLKNTTGAANGYHCWMTDRSIGSSTVAMSSANWNCTLANTAASAIIVGGSVHRNRWLDVTATLRGYSGADLSDTLALFSSHGPTRTGVIRPDIVAPGQGQASTMSYGATNDPAYILAGGTHRINQGTSMASPVVAGAAALLLQQNPALSAADVRGLITSTATTDAKSGSGMPNTSWGYGRLNVYRAMLKAIAPGVVSGWSAPTYDQWGSTGTVNFDANVKIAVRFRPDFPSDAVGMFFHTGSAVGFTGNLNLEIWSNGTGGMPGSKLGSTVTISRSKVEPWTWNHVDMRAAGVTVDTTADYHLVMYFTTGATTSLLTDNGAVDNRSTFYNGATWSAYGQDFRMRPALTRRIPTLAAGTYLVGGSGTTPCAGCAYVDLTAAMGDLSAKVLQGSVTLALQSSYSSAEEDSLPVTIPRGLDATTSSTVTIRPDAGVTASITGTSANAIIALLGARRVVIDGSNNGTASRNLTVHNASTDTASTVIRLSASNSSGVTDCTLKNLVITGASTSTTLAGLFAGGSRRATLTPGEGVHGNVTLDNAVVEQVRNGAYFAGVARDRLETRNAVTNSFMRHAGESGIVMRMQDSATVSGNRIAQCDNNAVRDLAGITLTDTRHAVVSANSIDSISQTGTSTSNLHVYGITSTTDTFTVAGRPSANTFANNTVCGLRSTGKPPTFSISGINSTGGYGDRYYYNTVAITGEPAGSATSAYAFSNGNAAVSSFAVNGDIRNNIFSIDASSNRAIACYAHYSKATTMTGSTLDYNDLFARAAGNAVAYTGWFNNAAKAALQDWKTATGQDAHSIASDPLFVGADDARVNPGAGYDPVPPVSRAGIPITGFATDGYGASRDTTAPDIGAHEFLVNRTLTTTGSLPGSAAYDAIALDGGGFTASLAGDVACDSLKLGGGTLSIGARTLCVSGGLNAAGGALAGGTTSKLRILGDAAHAAAIPAVTLGTLTLDRPRATCLAGEIAVTDSLQLTAGRLLLGNNHCTLGPAAVVAGAFSSSAMIVATDSGECRKQFSGPGAFTFPVGDSSGSCHYTPVTLTFTGGAYSGAFASVRVRPAKHGYNPSGTDYIRRYWSIGQEGITGFSCTVVCTYLPADVVGDETHIYGGRYDGAAWVQGDQADTVNHRITWVNVTGF